MMFVANTDPPRTYNRLMGLKPQELAVEESSGRTTALMYSAAAVARRPATLILAHGAGAPQTHPFMVSFAHALSERGIDVLTFNFLYAEQRRKAPDRMPQLVACYRAVIDAARAHVPSARDRLFIGGKSMGGRAATHVAAGDSTLTIDGVVLLGYPLHPPGRPDQLRDAHLPDVKRPMLFVQGSRDTFGTPSELKPILASLSPLPTLHHIDGGDHSFKIAGREAKTRQPAVYAEIQDTIAEWIEQVR
jgi:predicted alpha/beta-hydrolase family hydrolase